MSLATDLRDVTRVLLEPFIRLALRLIPVGDPWRRFARRVPLSLYGTGSQRDFGWYLEGESRVAVASVEEIQDWLLGCEYADDRELFHEHDFWQHPRTFEHLRRGDCEDHALWAWRKLVELGLDAELVSGRRLSTSGANEPASGHVWVLLTRGSETVVFETVSKTRKDMLRPLSEVRTEYRPEVGVNGGRKRFAYRGYLLTLRERRGGATREGALRAALTMMLCVLGATSRLPAQCTLGVTNVGVVDGSDSVVRRDQTVLIAGSRITHVGPARTTRAACERVLDGRGKFLIPGLWDMHVHTAVLAGRGVLALYVVNGVTGVRDMAGEWSTLSQWRGEIARGALVGPRIVASGPYLEGADVPIAHILARNPDEGRAAVDSLVRTGVDFVKVHGRLSRETYFAIARRARERGIAFAGHVSQAIGAAAASDSGQRSIEHLLGIPAPCTPAESLALRPRFQVQAAIGRCSSQDLAPLYARFVRNETWVTPTFTAAYEIAHWPWRDLPGDSVARFLPDTLRRFVLSIFPMPDSIPPGADSVGHAMFAKRLAQVGAMHRAGVRILTGTDAPLRNSPPGFGLHEELELLAKGGLSPFEILRAATLEPSRYLGTTDSLGTVAAGKLADLVLLDANPLDDIRNTRRIAAVVANGRLFDAAARSGILRAR